MPRNITEAELQLFTRGYIEAAVFTESGGDNPVLPSRFDAISVAHIDADCRAFVQANAEKMLEATDRIGYSWVRAGHDFWFSRNGHGVGYWDRRELEPDGLGDALWEACRHHEAYIYAAQGWTRYASTWPVSAAMLQHAA